MLFIRISAFAVDIPVSSVRVTRPNYPFNCFTLDLSQHKNILKNGEGKIFLLFRRIPATSVEILLEDKRLSCNRQLMEHKFYFSGPKIELDLGDS